VGRRASLKISKKVRVSANLLFSVDLFLVTIERVETPRTPLRSISACPSFTSLVPLLNLFIF
jgi:hypothetical protein